MLLYYHIYHNSSIGKKTIIDFVVEVYELIKTQFDT